MGKTIGFLMQCTNLDCLHQFSVDCVNLSDPCPKCGGQIEFLREYKLAISGGAWPPNYEEIDEPCRPLVRALNLLSGIATRESCCGHGERHFWIMFYVETLGKLMSLLSLLKAHLHSDMWVVRAEIAPPGRLIEKVWFRLVCKTLAGEPSYKEAERLALWLERNVQ